MNTDDLVWHLWWDIRRLGFNPDDENLRKLLKESYRLGYTDGVEDTKDEY